MNRILATCLLQGMLFLCMIPNCFAQSSTIPWSTLNAGGILSANSNVSVISSVGQLFVAPMSIDDIEVHSGFLFGLMSGTMTGVELNPAFTPGYSSPIVSFHFSNINGQPLLARFVVERTGTATNSDVPTVMLYEDANTDDVVDGGDTRLGEANYNGSGVASFSDLAYIITSGKNILVVDSVSPGAVISNTAGASIRVIDVSGDIGTVLAFDGINTDDYPLPLQLLSFSHSLTEERVLLEWTTISEINNYGFYVQRRLDDSLEVFTDLPDGFVAGAGTTVEEQHYRWSDKRVASGIYFYRLRQVDLNGDESYSEEIRVTVSQTLNAALPTLPTAFALHQNFPNPFNPSTDVRFEIPQPALVTLKVYSMLGEEVARLIDEVKEPGYYAVRWDATAFPSGVYYYRLIADSFTQVKRALLIR